MAYFGGSSRLAGDPGFFGSLFGGIKKIGGAAFRASPVGRFTSGLGLFNPPPPRATDQITRFIPPSGFLGPRGGGPARVPQITVDPVTGAVRRRSRRMNAANPKALRRAIRRTDGFVKLAKSALKNTGFKIVSKSAGKMTEAAFQKRAHHRK